MNMKVNIEIDCTPAEARPNVEPMQVAVMEQLQKNILAEMDRISPEAIMRTWLSLMPQGAEQMQKLFTEMFTQGAWPGEGVGVRASTGRHSFSRNQTR